MHTTPTPGAERSWRDRARPQHTPDGGQAGAVAAELVVATPLLLVLVLLVVQFALWQHGVHVATAAAEEGERAARLEGGTAAAGAARARDLLATLGPNLVIAPQVTAHRDQTTARVDIHATAEPLLPWLRLPIHAVAEGPVEVFQPAPAAGGPP